MSVGLLGRGELGAAIGVVWPEYGKRHSPLHMAQMITSQPPLKQTATAVTTIGTTILLPNKNASHDGLRLFHII